MSKLWKIREGVLKTLLFFSGMIICTAVSGAWALSVGDTVPGFTLQGVDGRAFSLSSLKGNPLSVLYFFNPGSRASVSGIELLSDIYRKQPGWDVNVVAISEGAREKTVSWAQRLDSRFRVLIDNGRVASLYGVAHVLPMAYLVGPDFRVLNKVSGGGESGHKLLVRLAERELSRKRVMVAADLARDAVKRAPSDPEAKAVLGYTALKQGKIDEAEDVFKQVSASPGGSAMGKEGLAYVRMKQGKSDEAFALASEAGGRAGAEVLRGDILYARGRKEDAKESYLKAQDKPAFGFQQSRPYNRLGKLAAAEKAYPEASRYYDRALEVDPFAVEVLSNKGVVLGREGKWDLAARTYQEVLRMSPGDRIALGLLRQAEEMLALARDAKKAERIDRLIKDLSQRYRKGKFFGREDRDEWTSRPMIMAFLPLTEGGLPMDRDGVAQVLTLDVGQKMEASGRVRVVERAVLDKLLAELNLGSSQLADPGTALRLGKVLAARILAAGSLYNGPGNVRLSLRLIDSETSAVPAIVSERFNAEQMEEYADKLASSLLKKLQAKYPLRGYVVKAKGDRVILNLGRKQGLRTGVRMALLVEGKPIKFMGKKLRGDLERAGTVEVTKVEEDLSYGRVLSASVKVKKGMKLEETAAVERNI